MWAHVFVMWLFHLGKFLQELTGLGLLHHSWTWGKNNRLINVLTISKKLTEITTGKKNTGTKKHSNIFHSEVAFTH